MSINQNEIFEQLQHPFFMVVGGIIFYHLTIWTFSGTSKNWWRQHYKSIFASFILGLLVIVWDDETAGLIQEYKADFTFKPYYYFMIAPAFELIKKGVKWLQGFNPFKKLPA